MLILKIFIIFFIDIFTRISPLCQWIEDISHIKCKNTTIAIPKHCQNRVIDVLKANNNQGKTIQHKTIGNSDEGKILRGKT